MKNITQHKIASALKISQPFISKVMTGQVKISWPMAEKLSDLFPGKSLKEWKNSGPEDIKRAFKQLEKETA